MNRLLLVIVVASVGAALAGGLMMVGGPGFARMERNDRQRAADLVQLGFHYRCAQVYRDRTQNGTLPGYCSRGDGPPPDLRDPVTHEAYAVTQDADTVKVCATFQVPAEDRRNTDTSQILFSGQQGCVAYDRRGKNWTLRSRS